MLFPALISGFARADNPNEVPEEVRFECPAKDFFHPVQCEIVFPTVIEKASSGNSYYVSTSGQDRRDCDRVVDGILLVGISNMDLPLPSRCAEAWSYLSLKFPSDCGLPASYDGVCLFLTENGMGETTGSPGTAHFNPGGESHYPDDCDIPNPGVAGTSSCNSSYNVHKHGHAVGTGTHTFETQTRYTRTWAEVEPKALEVLATSRWTITRV